MRRTKNDPSGKYAKAEEQYASEYNLSTRTIRAYKKQGAPLDDPAAMEDFLAAKHHGKIEEDPADLAAAKLLKVVLECRRLAHRNSVEAGKYTANAEIDRDHERIGAATRAALLSLRGDAPKMEGLSAPEIDAFLAERIDKICGDLSSDLAGLY